MAHARPVLTSLPLDILDEVAFYVAVLDPLGPPAHLVPLLCSCKTLYSLLCRANNPYLYARIFVAKFDARAAPRRMGETAGHSAALASQLTKYCKALRNLRRGDIDSPSITKDFLRAFVMCLENDGKNAAQLDWAGLFDYAERFILERLWEEGTQVGGWPVEDVTNALALWLYWCSATPERLASKTPEQRDEIMALVRPYALYNFRYPPFLAPDNHVHLPLPGNPEGYRDHSTMTPHGFYPLYRTPSLCQHTFRHYGRKVTIAEPPIGLVAKLLYIALQEYKPIDLEQPIPDDRAEAIFLGTRGPTRADYSEFARTKAVRYAPRGEWYTHPPRPSSGPSTIHDIDWARWRQCRDPWATVTSPRVPMYKFGSLTGRWGGRSLVSPPPLPPTTRTPA
ncbi:hypothetical protein C8Q77DRAFT_712041 [Trametes polyzona]|nr:hypothetical protein C8Q77DRAFT_712041 [Trametes polyzona]